MSHAIDYTKEKGIDKKELDGEDYIYFQSIVEDNDQNLWMQTYADGIWKYDGEKMTNYPVLNGGFKVRVISMYKDNSGKLWLGTEENGVYQFNGEQFEKFNFKQL